jgi:hypothetical protein
MLLSTFAWACMGIPRGYDEPYSVDRKPLPRATIPTNGRLVVWVEAACREGGCRRSWSEEPEAIPKIRVELSAGGQPIRIQTRALGELSVHAIEVRPLTPLAPGSEVTLRVQRADIIVLDATQPPLNADRVRSWVSETTIGVGRHLDVEAPRWQGEVTASYYASGFSCDPGGRTVQIELDGEYRANDSWLLLGIWRANAAGVFAYEHPPEMWVPVRPRNVLGHPDAAMAWLGTMGSGVPNLALDGGELRLGLKLMDLAGNLSPAREVSAAANRWAVP